MARKRSRKTNNLRRQLPIILLVFGITLFFLGTASHIQIYINSVRLSQKEAPQEIPTGEDPRLIVIPSSGIKANVKQGGIVNREWILSDKDALYLPSSGKIGEGYNTIIYAHNRENLFKNLKKVKKDDLILILSNKDRTFTYKVYSIEDINPRDVDKLYSSEKDILTLFTCDGWFDRERLLVRAKLINVTIPSTKAPMSF